MCALIFKFLNYVVCDEVEKFLGGGTKPVLEAFVQQQFVRDIWSVDTLFVLLPDEKTPNELSVHE